MFQTTNQPLIFRWDQDSRTRLVHDYSRHPVAHVIGMRQGDSPTGKILSH